MQKKSKRNTREQPWPTTDDSNYPVGKDEIKREQEPMWPMPERPNDEPHPLESGGMFDDTELAILAGLREARERRRLQLELGMSDEEISADAAADIAAAKAKRQRVALEALRAARERAQDAPEWLRRWPE